MILANMETEIPTIYMGKVKDRHVQTPHLYFVKAKLKK